MTGKTSTERKRGQCGLEGPAFVGKQLQAIVGLLSAIRGDAHEMMLYGSFDEIATDKGDTWAWALLFIYTAAIVVFTVWLASTLGKQGWLGFGVASPPPQAAPQEKSRRDVATQSQAIHTYVARRGAPTTNSMFFPLEDCEHGASGSLAVRALASVPQMLPGSARRERAALSNG